MNTSRTDPQRRRDRRAVLLLTAAAIALRLILFLGRGDYVAFDEGWYLLLGRSLLAGDGYTLSGLRHVALSPLFPAVAGALDRLLDDPVLAGRLVAAAAAGLLVVPCWSLFRRLAGRRTALLACGLVAVLPSLAPFVVPFWIGWDLWVGAEPLLHLFLYAGIALALRALERNRAVDWAPAGIAFGLAYLARPEAVIAAGLVGAAAAVSTLRRGLRGLLGPAVLGFAFAAAALPYWSYLHDVLGRWALTGRSVEVALPSFERSAAGRPAGQGATATIERMLWHDDETSYIRRLYGLDASGTRLLSTYWGIPAAPADGAASPRAAAADPPRPPETAAAESARAPAAGESGGEAAPAKAAPDGQPAEAASGGSGAASRIGRYVRALGVIVPWYVWPFVILGALVPRRRSWRDELTAIMPLVGTSVLVAVVVAVDPRTQLFLAPALAFYAARGLRLAGSGITRYARSAGLHRRFATGALAALCFAFLLGTDARRLYLSATVGSPHHVVGAENRRVGRELRRLVPEDAPVMSWHPAIALYARRDWRVLPYASLEQVVRYAAANRIEHVVFSGYYPPDWVMEQLPGEYMVLRVPPGAADGAAWRVEVTEAAAGIRLGTIRPAPPAGGE